MKNKLLFIAFALLLAVLSREKAYSQNSLIYDTYFFVAVDHHTNHPLPADTVPRVEEIGCSTPIDIVESGYWTREVIFKYLYDKGIGIMTR